MTPVYQTIIGKTTSDTPGNCMQAVIASLLDLKLDEVPHFLLYGNKWYETYYYFLLSKGYEDMRIIYNPYALGHCGERDEFFNIKKLPPEYCGVGGYFYATVYSPGFTDPKEFFEDPFGAPLHAVIVDNQFNVVHDPNPNYKGITKYPLHKGMGDSNGVKSIHMISKLY
jgi:hypothetical protein